VRSTGVVAPFKVEDVLAPDVVQEILDGAGVRSEADAPMSHFRKGLALLEKHNLEAAAMAFRDSMHAARVDFYPGMVYIGACYAAGGKDKDAVNVWRTALIKESDAAPVHRLLIDALMRLGYGDMALDMAVGARARWPENTGFTRQFAVAALAGGKPLDGLKALDELVAAHAVDEPSLALALMTIYEALQTGRPIETVEQDRERLLRLAGIYREHGGPSMALVDTWVAAVNVKK